MATEPNVLNIRVAGVSFDGRQALIARLVTSDPCRIVPEPDNKFDPNALAVHVASGGEVLHIGYIPKEFAARIAPLLDGESLMVKIAELTGGFELQNGQTAPLGVRLLIELPTEIKKS